MTEITRIAQLIEFAVIGLINYSPIWSCQLAASRIQHVVRFFTVITWYLMYSRTENGWQNDILWYQWTSPQLITFLFNFCGLPKRCAHTSKEWKRLIKFIWLIYDFASLQLCVGWIFFYYRFHSARISCGGCHNVSDLSFTVFFFSLGLSADRRMLIMFSLTQKLFIS